MDPLLEIIPSLVREELAVSTENDTKTSPNGDAEMAAPQPAGEHHTGTLNLAGQGNPGDSLSALDDEICRTYGAIHAPDNLAEILAKHGWAKVSETRQQVAEQIAAALEAVPGEVYSEDFFPADGTSVDCHSARVMRVAYPAAARIAREIGGVRS